MTVRSLLESTGIRFTVARFGRRALLFRQGDPSDSVLHIENGLVQLTVTARNGKEAICGVLRAGAFLGEDALRDRGARPESAVAMVPTDVLIVARERMTDLLRAHPAMRERMLAHILTRSALLQANLADQRLNLSEQRLARTLFLLAGCNAQRPCTCQLPRVSQETIAEMVGTTRSRVSAFMGRFRKLGFLEEEDGVLRVKPSLLHVVYGAGHLSRTEHLRISGNVNVDEGSFARVGR